MKKLLITALVAMIPFISANEMPNIGNLIVTKSPQKVLFMPAYNTIVKYEANYSNHPKDRGGETYRGISRKSSPNWKGWEYIDKVKMDSIRKNPKWKGFKWNTKFDEMVEHYALHFFLDIWVKEGWCEMKDQQVANYLFEFRINATLGVKIIQQSLNDLGIVTKENNLMDEKLAMVINSADKDDLLRIVQIKRMRFYIGIIERQVNTNHLENKVDQIRFLSHWMERTINL